ncbi:hypothetical protein LINGRAHAP2_LOCUS6226 [Linum grandiflorum]
MGYSHHDLHHDERFLLDSDMHMLNDVDYDDDLTDNDDSDQWPVLDVSSHPYLEMESSSSSTLSTEDVIRLAGMRVIHMTSSNSHKNDDGDISLSGLPDRDVRSVTLTGYLLSSADNVAKGRFDQALGLLGLCDGLASSQANPVDRVVRYFSKALRAKIAKETGTVHQNMIVIRDHNILPLDDTSLVSSCQIIQHVAATQAKVEASRRNSPRFATRFVEMLFHYGELFDVLDTCTGDDVRERTVVESTYLSKLIMNAVVD